MENTYISKELFKDIFSNKKLISEEIIELFSFIYKNNGEATATEVTKALRYKAPVVANGIIGRFGKNISKIYHIERTKRDDGTLRCWDIFFEWYKKDKYFVWVMKKELKEALEELSLIERNLFPDEISIGNNLFEGTKKTITVNAYERNYIARNQCVKHYGLNCMVCGLNFEEHYGDIGNDFIHVHHIVKISEIGKNYKVDPINDLIPVCPNCHAMLHKKEPPFTISELKEKLK